MIVRPTGIAGLAVLDVEPHVDERGGFARAYCASELAAAGLDATIAQVNVSWNERAGTLRGLHFQVDPPEAKLLRCTAGAVWDVAVDVRPDSPTYLHWFGVELTAVSRRAVYVPAGCAHAYLALTDGAEVLYSTSAPYTPGQERGLRWDDPRLAIDWPRPVTVVSAKDSSWPLLPPGGPA